MYRNANILLLKNETSLHAGSGDSLGIVDMPVQRERHTTYPKIEASSLKGSIREHFERHVNIDEYAITEKKLKAAFGFEGNDGGANAGALGFSDARLLLFPVMSVKGVFAWITCQQVLQKFSDELQLADVKNIPGKIPNDHYFVAENSNICVKDNAIVLEEYAFTVEKNNFVNKLGVFLSEQFFGENNDTYFAKKMKTDIVILKNDDFRDFVNLSTEYITRTKISPLTGTVESGALFTEEYLPPETLMYSMVLTAPEFAEKEADKILNTEEKMRTFFADFLNKINIFQIGGNATLGKGITKAKFIN